MNITLDKQEAILLLLYCGDDRNDTIQNLREIQTHLHADEQDHRQMADSLIGKLREIGDKDFSVVLDLVDDAV